jgi:hypothetical protein
MKTKASDKHSMLTALHHVQGPIWRWACDCGNQIDTRAAHVRSGNTKSCGCLKLQTLRQNQPVHGHAQKGNKSPEYWAWASMIQRCHNPNAQAYHNYGARGIKVCEEWRTSFVAFIKHMGNRPSPKHSLDRINNDGDYEPRNCKWSTKSDQAKNRRRLHPKSIWPLPA